MKAKAPPEPAEMTLYPTGKCFDDAVEIITAFLRTDPRHAGRKDLFIVHGIVEGPEYSFSHAWVLDEARKTVFQFHFLNGERIGVEYTLEQFNHHFKVTDEKRYTLREFDRLNRTHMTYGPWEDKYRRLTLDVIGPKGPQRTK